MSNQPAPRTQFVIFVLFGDVIGPRGGWAWTASLLQMLEVLGVSERAARSALSRMRRKGWIKPERDGRHSLYALTSKGRRIIEEGSQRIFEPRRREWSGRWQMVVYSLPEKKRGLRNDLRKRLAWLGFGRLAPGTWISPHNRRAEVESLLSDLDAHDYAQVFSDAHLSSGDDRELAARCWNLADLNRQYARFVARWEPHYDRCAAALVRGGGPTPAQCFAQRFWVTHEYSPFPRLDPNLPDVLVPDDWKGERATEIFNGFRGLLSARAIEFVEHAFQSPNGHHT
jgi:phenylacetic acid degradation operon negative regulatory protein